MTVVAIFHRGKILWGLAEGERVWTPQRVFRQPPEVLLRWEIPQPVPRSDAEKKRLLQEVLSTLPSPPVEDLWQLLEGETLSIGDFLNLAEDPPSRAALLTLLERHRAFVLHRSGEVRVKTREELARETRVAREARERQQAREALVRWIQNPSAEAVASLPPPMVEALRRYALHGEPPPELEGLSLPPPDSVLEKLEQAGLIPRHVNEIPYRLQVVRAFRESPGLPLPERPHFASLLEEFREDGIAVDAAETVEVDDAFAFSRSGDRWRFSLYIAAPAAWIPPDHPLVQVAERRVLTLYFPENTWFLFPEPWIRERFTLTPDEARPALILDMEGVGSQVEGYRFRWGWVRLQSRWVPDELRTFLLKDPDGKVLHALTRAWQRAREDRGAFSVLLPDVKVRVSEEGRVLVHREIPHEGHLAVMEWMIRINHLAAVEALRRGFPVSFRASDPPDRRPTREEMEDPLFPTYVGQFFAPAYWTSQPRPHYGLGVEVYTQVSSPIRRFLDFVIQMQWLHAEDTGRAAYPVEAMIDWAQRYESFSARARQGMRKRKVYWILVWLDQERPVLEGRLLRPDRVYFPQFHYQGILQPAVNLPRGSPVSVQVKRAYPRRGLLYVRPLRGA